MLFVRLPAHHSAAIPVKVEELVGSVLIETEGQQLDDGLHIEDLVVKVDKDGHSNNYNFLPREFTMSS